MSWIAYAGARTWKLCSTEGEVNLFAEKLLKEGVAEVQVFELQYKLSVTFKREAAK